MQILTHKELYDRYLINVGDDSKKEIKSILTAMEKHGYSSLVKQKINMNEEKFYYLYSLLIKLKEIFDTRYNDRNDLEIFFDYVLQSIDGIPINFYAIFCPGYNDDGYKDRLGKTTTIKIQKLFQMKHWRDKENSLHNIPCLYADIFLENCDELKNPNWEKELEVNKNLFKEYAIKYLECADIDFLSSYFPDSKYQRGFVDSSIINGNNYESFRKYNNNFYMKMGWDDAKAKERNDKLYTIYNIIAEYIINTKSNGIYLPMENMYARTKVFTKKKVGSMYFKL